VASGLTTDNGFKLIVLLKTTTDFESPNKLNWRGEDYDGQFKFWVESRWNWRVIWAWTWI